MRKPGRKRENFYQKVLLNSVKNSQIREIKNAILTEITSRFAGEISQLHFSGRLRPHFLSVCQPNWKSLNCSIGYITQDVCTGDTIAVREARLSFPSGHSSLAFYCACFLVFYLHKRGFVIRTLRIIIPGISLVAIILALFTALSRVSDNKHHPTDVLAGSLVGATSAAYACYLVPSFEQIKRSKQVSVCSNPAAIKSACKNCNCFESESE